MLRGTPHLVSVFLCFVCLLALTPHPAAKVCTLDTIIRVKSLMKKAPNLMWLDSRLYTPSREDNEQRCPSSALRCFAAEVTVLTKEWREVGVNVTSGLDRILQNLARKFKRAESDCRQCELLQEENAVTFLDFLLSTLQHMNDVNCIR